VPPSSEVVAAGNTRVHAAVRPWSIEGIYANFVSTTNQDRMKATYDDVSLRRLQSLIRQHDPLGTLGTVGQLAR
jgi:hypothetical protein